MGAEALELALRTFTRPSSKDMAKQHEGCCGGGRREGMSVKHERRERESPCGAEALRYAGITGLQRHSAHPHQ
jgi:hypothetical protein